MHGFLLFPIKMAWRETRGAWRHFLYFFLCIALGVAALVSIALFANSMERSVTREARSLMGADLELRLSHPLGRSGEAVLDELRNRGVAVSHVSELVAMATGVTSQPDVSPSQIIELKAVEEGYPFYGTVRVNPNRRLGELIGSAQSGRHRADTPAFGAVVQPALLIKMGLEVGDSFRIGEARFVITGIVEKEPDRIASLFSLGPRVMISQDALAAAALVKPGSRIRERFLLRLPPETPLEPILSELRDRLSGESVRVLSYREAQPQLRRLLGQLSTYLGLVGLTALFVGGIGVAGTVRAFIQEKFTTIALLKTVGTDSWTVTTSYLLQALFLGLIGSLAGALLGLALEHVFPILLADLLPLEQLDVRLTPSAPPILKGLALGVLTTLLFSLWPLLEVRRIRPAMILRRAVAPSDMASASSGHRTASATTDRQGQNCLDRLAIGTTLGIGLGLAALAVWQAGSLKVGTIFIGALLTAVAVLLIAAVGVAKATSRLPVPRAIPIRHALRNLHRPGSQTVVILLSVGLGVMVMLAASLLEGSLLNEIGESQPVDAPTFFFIDIQPDQQDGFVRLLQEAVAYAEPTVTPLVRSRLYAVNGRRVEHHQVEESGSPDRQRENWYFTREYVLTFLGDLPKDNGILRGDWWSPSERPAEPEVSVEDEAARNLGLDLGSVVEFDIQGAIVTAVVRSIRKVDWSNFSTNFYMILSPGSLEGAPFTYVATARVAPADQLPLQQAVVRRFPNVTAINLGDVMENLARVLERLSIAIRAIALFCIVAGAVVMAAALVTTRRQRLYESVILKAVGATRGIVAQAFAAEYALLGAIAGAVGAVLASLLAWVVLAYVLEMSWKLQPSVLAVGVLLTIALTVAVGFLGTFRILNEPPLAVLRGE
jgi:putative ABC transport system permease protein